MLNRSVNFVKLRFLGLVKILVIDFYDSFVYNLVHYLESMGCKVDVLSDHEIHVDTLHFLNLYNGIVLSPGPGLPQETSSMMEVISYCKSRIPILGVCLGMQGLGLAAKAQLVNLDRIRHGVHVNVEVIRDSILFKDLPGTFEVGLYHSWGFTAFRPELITAIDRHGIVMAIENEVEQWYGVQFHPESIMTSFGRTMLKNVVHNVFSAEKTH